MEDRRKDGGTNFILRIKKQETRLTLQKHAAAADDDDDNDDDGDELNDRYVTILFRCNYYKTRSL